MAQKIQLVIETDAHMEGMEKAQRNLEQLGVAGQNANKIFKTSGNLDAYNEAIKRIYHTTGETKGQVKAATSAFSAYHKAMTVAQERLGKGLSFGILSDDGLSTRLTKDIKEIGSYLSRTMNDVQMDTDNYRKSLTRDMPMDWLSRFQSGMDANAKATGIFGSKLDVVRQKMGTLQQEIESQTVSGGSEKNIEAMKAQWVSLAEQEQKLLTSFDSDDFYDGVEKRGESVKMFGTELDSVRTKMGMIKQQGEYLSSIGGDPEQIKKLSQEYANLSKESERLSQSSSGTGARIKNLVKNFVSAQLVVWAIRKTIQSLTTGIKEASDAAAEAEQITQKFLTVFDRVPEAAESVSKLVGSFGLSTVSSQNILATIGDMAYGLGASQEEAAKFSDTTATFIQDLIAFKDIGGDVIEVTQGFMSGVAGNTRNFRQWGSIVKEATIQARIHEKGLDELTGSSLEWAKAQERVAVVMEQQKNAIGATQREWDMMLSVTRRLNEQQKELNILLGNTVNRVLGPIKRGILGITEQWVSALKHAEAYRNGVKGIYVPSESMNKEIKKEFRAVDFLGGAIDVGKKNVKAEEFIDVQQEYGIPWQDLLAVIDGYAKLADGELAKLREYYKKLNAQIASEDSRRDQGNKRSAREKFFNDEMAEMNDMFLNLGANMYANQDASSFSFGYSLDSILGFSDNELQTKIDKLVEDAQTINNKLITELQKPVNEQDNQLVQNWTNSLGILEDSIRSTYSTQQVESFNDSVKSQLSQANKRNELENIYGDKQSEVTDLLFNQWTKEQELLEMLNSKKITQEQYNESMDNVAELYKVLVGYAQKQLSIDKETANEKERQEEIEANINRLLEARVDISNGIMSNDALRRNLERNWDETPKQAARFNYKEALVGVGTAMESFLTDNVLSKNQLKAVDAGISIDDLSKLLVSQDQYKMNEKTGDMTWFLNPTQMKAFNSGLSLETLQESLDLSAEQLAIINEKSLSLEETARLEYLQELKDIRDEELRTIKDNYDAVQEGIASAWASIGDIGMVEGWKDIFDAVKKYAMDIEGKSEGEASKDAWSQGWMAVLMEFLGRLDSVNEILGIIGRFMDKLAPIIDQLLAPLIAVLEPILNMLIELFLPILLELFPVIQIIATVLMYLVAVVRTVINAINWMKDSIGVFVYNLSHWFNPRTYRNLGEETAEIWAEANSTVEEIWAMEIDARSDYVNKLTEAQKGELDAYNEMFKNGLLTLTQYQAMVGSNIYGKNFDNVAIESFAKGGDFVTNGERLIRVGEDGREHVQITPLNSTRYADRRMVSSNSSSYSVVVNGANSNPEQIAVAVKREFKKMERRGVAYA